MNSQNKFNILGIILVFIMIIGSWGLTKYLLHRKEIDILSEIDGFDISINRESESSNSDLTIDQIRDILVSWNDSRDIKVHDPTINQLTMDEAVNKSISDIKNFCEKGVLPSSFKSIDDTWNTYAYLGTKAPIDVFLWDRYSYWIIGFSNENFLIEINQNAYTGQIWKIVAYDFDDSNDDINEINIEESLKIYASYLGISMGNYSKSELGYGSLTSDDSRLILSYQNNTLNQKDNRIVEVTLSPN